MRQHQVTWTIVESWFGRSLALAISYRRLDTLPFHIQATAGYRGPIPMTQLHHADPDVSTSSARSARRWHSLLCPRNSINAISCERPLVGMNPACTMGQVPSIPSSHWSTYLLFEADSLSNNIITCNELGIRYRIYTPLTIGIFKDPVTSIYRWDNETQQEILIAEIEKLIFSSQRIRMAPGTGLDALGPSAPFVPVGEFFPKTGVWSNK